ncbi:MAG: PEGA domain-containing protein [Kiritimatiellae bacterium]|nr:PEGA domain-containing protein [Kiritimatiellia bacterium]
MKKIISFAFLCVSLSTGTAQEPIRVALYDFEDQTASSPDRNLVDMNTDSLAEKGIYLMGKHLLDRGDGYVLIDRRDFISQMKRLQLKDNDIETPTQPSFIHAAQALNANVVLRGTLASLSTRKKEINQGGYQTDFMTLSARVVLEALDAVDGTVISMADGVASQKHRQTVEVRTQLSEEDVLQLVEKALQPAVQEVREALRNRIATEKERPKIKLTVNVSGDEGPALVSIDGILVGTTPLENFEVYQGDHVLTIGKAGYRDITKRILLQKDTEIEAPLFRKELTAEELKDILQQARIHGFIGVEPAIEERQNAVSKQIER